jgi:TolA-binding protein
VSLRRPSPEELVDPVRLLGQDGAHQGGQSNAEKQAADLLRRVGEPTPPSPQRLEALERLVLASRRSSAGASRRGLVLPRLGWALLFFLFVSSGALAAWFSARHKVAVAPSAEPQSDPSPGKVRAPATQTQPTEGPAPARTSVAGASPHAPGRITRHHSLWRALGLQTPAHTIASSAPADASAAGSFGAEGELLRRALRALREDKDSTAALTALDEYARTYPQGRLLHEAAVARLEALMLAGKRAQALSALEGGLPALVPLGRAELVLRGELRAGTDRLAAARDDFEAAWSRGGNDKLASRALLDLARTQQSLGERSAAAASLRRYLEAFPRGSGADEARRALDGP